MRQRLESYGPRGATVTLFRLTTAGGDPAFGVEWREWYGDRCVRRSRQFPGDSRRVERDARTFAESVAAALVAPPQPDTVGSVRDLWEAYYTSRAPDWRVKTRQLNAARWASLEPLLGARTDATTVGPAQLDRVRAALLSVPRKHGKPMARNQVAHHLQLLKSVWAFGAERGLLPSNPLASYGVRRGRDYAPRVIPEFQPEEWVRLLGAFDPRHPLQWRPWVALQLLGLQASRSNALLTLPWSAVDWQARTIRWPASSDKLGRERVQPLPRDAVHALRVAAVWRRREAPDAPYILFGAQGRTRHSHWRYQALIAQLHAACDRLGIERIPYRGLHSLRRMRATSVTAATGNLDLAARWLGSTDLGTFKRSYLRDRPGDLEQVAQGVRVPKGTV